MARSLKNIRKDKDVSIGLSSSVVGNAAEKLQDDIKEAQAYLNSTDWYYIRKIEEDIAVPEDVITARATAKELIRTSS